jgi:hypothetical protein
MAADAQRTIGNNIAQLRRVLPMTQEALAEASGVSVETIRKPTWLRHQRYARDIVTAIAGERKRAMSRGLAELAALVGMEI